MQEVARASEVLHNMTVETRRQDYNGDGPGGWSAVFDIHEDEKDIDYQLVRSENAFDFINEEKYVSDDIKVKGLHRQLTGTLVDHVRDLSGKI